MKIHTFHTLALISTIQRQVAALVEPWPDAANAENQQFTAEVDADDNDLRLIYRYTPDLSKDRVRLVVLRLLPCPDAIDQLLDLSFTILNAGKPESSSLGRHCFSCHPPGPGTAASALSTAIYTFLWKELDPGEDFEIFNHE